MRVTASKLISTLRWLPAYLRQQRPWRPRREHGVHVILAIADHFEPSIVPETPRCWAPPDLQEQRVEQWCREYPVLGAWRDSDGYPLRHTYFYPAEQYSPTLLERLAEHCHSGWGELEVQLHHGIDAPATAQETRQRLVQFRDALARLGCLSRWNSAGQPRYAFVHGNFALANSDGGRYCGVDEEMQILAETGCYADLTMPSAPEPSQVRKINALYECAASLTHRAPHRLGRDLRCGRPPHVFPLMIAGPLGLDFSRPGRGWPVPYIENGALTGRRPPSLRRLAIWRQASIGVIGRPDWRFVKLHCHGMDPRDKEVMLGGAIQDFLRALLRDAAAGEYSVHFVTAREMVNIALAACDGRDGAPGQYRDYRLRLAG